MSTTTSSTSIPTPSRAPQGLMEDRPSRRSGQRAQPAATPGLPEDRLSRESNRSSANAAQATGPKPAAPGGGKLPDDRRSKLSQAQRDARNCAKKAVQNVAKDAKVAPFIQELVNHPSDADLTVLLGKARLQLAAVGYDMSLLVLFVGAGEMCNWTNTAPGLQVGSMLHQCFVPAQCIELAKKYGFTLPKK